MDRFAAGAGCQITEVDAEHAVAVMKVTDKHLNGGKLSLHILNQGHIFRAFLFMIFKKGGQPSAL